MTSVGNDYAYFKVYDSGLYGDLLANTQPYRFERLIVELFFNKYL